MQNYEQLKQDYKTFRLLNRKKKEEKEKWEIRKCKKVPYMSYAIC